LIETSVDGRAWEAAARVAGDRGAFFWAEDKPMFSSGPGPLEAGFAPRSARYLRLSLTGSRAGFRWSIGEMAVYSALEQEPGPRDGLAALKAALTAAGPEGRVLAPPWLYARAVELLNDPDWCGPRPALASEARVDSPRGLVIVSQPVFAEQVVETLERAGWSHQVRRVGGYVVLRMTGGVSEPAGTPLPASAWRAEGGVNVAALENLHGRDQSARWDTGQVQRPGLGFTVTLERPTLVSGLRLDTGRWPGDFPWGLEIQAMDGSGRWEPVEAHWLARPPLHFNGSHLLTLGRGRQLAIFASRPVKALSLTLTAASQGAFWSVARLELLSPD
jgi:hypothetical protein